MDQRLILVGGVPGAGKSTAIESYIGMPGVVALDPDRVRDQLRWRPLVHLVHQVAAWSTILLGPDVVRRTVILHETATRSKRREAMLRWAVRRRWRPWLLLIEVDRFDALAGQAARGRMVPAHEFDRHWSRWQRLRREGFDPAGLAHTGGIDQSGCGFEVHREIVPQHAIRSALARAMTTAPPIKL